ISQEDQQEGASDLTQAKTFLSELQNAADGSAEQARNLGSLCQFLRLESEKDSTEESIEGLLDAVATFVCDKALEGVALPPSLKRLVGLLAKLETRLSDASFGDSKAKLFFRAHELFDRTRAEGGIDVARFRSYSVALSVLVAWLGCFRPPLTMSSEGLPLRTADYVTVVDQMFALAEETIRMPSLEDPFVAETLVACLKAFVSLASKHLHYIGTTWTHTLEQWVDLAKEVLDHPPGQAAAYAKVLGAAVKVVCLSSAVEPKGKKGKGRKGKAKTENATLTKMFEIALRCLRDHNEGNRVLPAEVIRGLLTMLSTRSRKFFKEPAFHFIHSYFPLLRLSAEDAQLVDAQPREFLRKHVETIPSLETPMLAAVDDAIGYPISSMTPADLAETQQFLAAFAAKPGATELDRVQALLAYSPLIERLERSLPSEVAVFDQVRAWFAAAYPASSDASSSSLLLFAVIRLLRAFLITDIPTFTAEERQTASLRLIGLLVRDGAPVRRTFACLALATLVDQSAVVDNGDEDEDEEEDELA